MLDSRCAGQELEVDSNRSSIFSADLPTTTSSVSLRGGSTWTPWRGVSGETFSIGRKRKPI